MGISVAWGFGSHPGRGLGGRCAQIGRDGCTRRRMGCGRQLPSTLPPTTLCHSSIALARATDMGITRSLVPCLLRLAGHLTLLTFQMVTANRNSHVMVKP
jgi:hypothetical protein